MDIRALEIAVQREAIFSLAVLIVLTIAMIWITYVIIKNAIRDGIRESGLIEAARSRNIETKRAFDLPDMRAD